jgi:hypothetical protein
MAEEKFTQLPIVQAGAATIAGVVKLANIKSKLLTVSYSLLFCSARFLYSLCKIVRYLYRMFSFHNSL